MTPNAATFERPANAFSLDIGRRRGFSLIELLIAMTAGSVVFCLAVELLGLAIRADTFGHDHSDVTASLLRVAEQFRADAHAALSVATPAAPPVATKINSRWSFTLPEDRRIEYESRDDLLMRTEYRADKVHSRDAFRLPHDAAPRLEVQSADGPHEASLVIHRGADAENAAAGYLLRIDAELGRDQRLTAGPASKKSS